MTNRKKRPAAPTAGGTTGHERPAPLPVGEDRDMQRVRAFIERCFEGCMSEIRVARAEWQAQR